MMFFESEPETTRRGHKIRKQATGWDDRQTDRLMSNKEHGALYSPPRAQSSRQIVELGVGVPESPGEGMLPLQEAHGEDRALGRRLGYPARHE